MCICCYGIALCDYATERKRDFWTNANKKPVDTILLSLCVVAAVFIVKLYRWVINLHSISILNGHSDGKNDLGFLLTLSFEFVFL